LSYIEQVYLIDIEYNIDMFFHYLSLPFFIHSSSHNHFPSSSPIGKRSSFLITSQISQHLFSPHVSFYHSLITQLPFIIFQVSLISFEFPSSIHYISYLSNLCTISPYVSFYKSLINNYLTSCEFL